MEQFDDDSVTESFLDSREYKAFCALVLSVTTGKMHLSDYRRAMGDAFNDRLILDALNTLVGAGAVRECDGYRLAWEPTGVTKTTPRHDKHIHLDVNPTDHSRPIPESYPAAGNRRGGWY